MSVIKTSNVSWNNIKVDQYTNIQTGYTYITLAGQTTKLAESTGADWVISDLNAYTRLYNGANLTTLTNTEVKKLFYRSAVPVYNNVRTGVINDKDNYPDGTFDIYMLGMFKNRIPGAVNPTDGRVVTSEGKATSQNPFNTSVPTTSTLQTNTSGVVGATENYSYANDVQLFSTGNSNSYRKNNYSGTLRYPLAQLDGHDYLSFTAFPYRARGAQGNSLLGGLDTQIFSGGGEGTVQLPLQAPVKSMNQVGWSGEQMNFIQGALASAGIGFMDDASEGRIGDAFKNALASLGDSAGSILGDMNTDEFIKNYFVGKPLGINLNRRRTGLIVNPNMEMFFNGPEIRTFNFNFTMTPRSEEESDVIRKIVRFFKRHMAPQVSSSGAFLYTPDVFQLKYIFNGEGQHPFLNEFKPCALLNFDTTYGSNGYNTYDNGSLTQYTITLTFTELMPIFRKDQNNSTAMGF